MEKRDLLSLSSPSAARTKAVTARYFRPPTGRVIRMVRIVIMALGVLAVTFMGTTIFESIFLSDWLTSL